MVTPIRSTVLLAELGKSELVPEKVPASGYEPAATVGVMKQLAVPLASVVPLQVWPANEKLKGTFTTSATGLADTSASVPVIFNEQHP